jgi:TusA-related sulfurtransferase
MEAGDILEVLGDSPAFKRDIRGWCERLRNALLYVRNGGGNSQKRTQIQSKANQKN